MQTISITTSLGTIQGEQHAPYCIFKGIPYAKAPIGKLRFCPPQPLEPFGSYDAFQFPSACPQKDMSLDPFYGKEFYTNPDFPLPNQSEDCLYLNIWTPSTQKEGGYPVAVWIHGGAFDHGFGHEMEFDGEAYAKHGVILVTINYRVGVFGFFAHPNLLQESGTTGNYGILDQIMALQWVHDHISSFGGDPNQVTVFGQSAGAISTQTLLSSSLTNNLIHRAIMQSGAGYHNHLSSAHILEEAYKVSEKILSLCGVSTIEELRQVPVQQFVDVLPELYQSFPRLAFRPTIDGYVLKENLNEAIHNHHFLNIPVLLGSTSHDVTVDPKRDATNGDLYKGCLNFAFVHPNRTYLYYFSHKLPGDQAGAFHSSELWYMFSTLQRSWRPMTVNDMALSRTMVQYWTEFIKTGIPDYYWPACNIEQKIPYIKTLE